MSKIFGISSLPVANPFPSLEFGANNSIRPSFEQPKYILPKTNIYVSSKVSGSKDVLKRFFSKVKH